MSDQKPVPLLLMADYMADPLWTRTSSGLGECSISLESLPLSRRLREQLRAWAARYDARLHTDNKWQSQEDEALWLSDGRALLTSVREELGPDYDVQYFEEPPGDYIENSSPQ